MPANNQQIQIAQTPEGLLSAIIRRIDAERKALSLRQRFFVSVIFCIGMFALFLSVWHGFKADFDQSGFGQYLSLLFSDFRAVMSDWQDYAFSLMESFPIVSTIEMLGALFALLWTLKYAIKYSKGFFVSYFLEAK